MEMNQLAGEMRALKDQLGKAAVEITTKVANLEAKIAESNAMTADVESALVELKGSVQMIDDLNPDPVPTEEPTPEPQPEEQVQ